MKCVTHMTLECNDCSSNDIWPGVMNVWEEAVMESVEFCSKDVICTDDKEQALNEKSK